MQVLASEAAPLNSLSDHTLDTYYILVLLLLTYYCKHYTDLLAQIPLVLLLVAGLYLFLA